MNFDSHVEVRHANTASGKFEGDSNVHFDQVRKTVLEYPFLSMVAEIGGYVGLLLGVALVDVGLVLERAAARIIYRKE